MARTFLGRIPTVEVGNSQVLFWRTLCELRHARPCSRQRMRVARIDSKRHARSHRSPNIQEFRACCAVYPCSAGPDVLNNRISELGAQLSNKCSSKKRNSISDRRFRYLLVKGVISRAGAVCLATAAVIAMRESGMHENRIQNSDGEKLRRVSPPMCRNFYSSVPDQRA